MLWSSAGSGKRSLAEAIHDAGIAIRERLGGRRPDLVVAFASHHHADSWDRLPAMVEEFLDPRHLLGCSAGGVIGGGHEIEDAPGLSLTAAVLPDVSIRPFSLTDDELPGLDDSPRWWQEAIGVPVEEGTNFLLLPEPFSSDAESIVTGIDYAYPGSLTIGGLASGAQAPGRNILFQDGVTKREGLVGVALSGAIRVETIVAQGCRPVGPVFTVTRCDGNILAELDDRPPLEVLREVYRDLSGRDRELFGHSLFLGLVMDDDRDDPGPGDFLVRNILGADEERGAMAIGAALLLGQRVQFQLRDAATSAADLRSLLDAHARESAGAPAGALLFSCLGRGTHLYGRADHDTDCFREIVGEYPLGGFFCNGEIGPVGNRTWVHGYTSAFGVFRAEP